MTAPSTSGTTAVDWKKSFTCEVGAARSGTNFLGEVLSQHPMFAYWRRPKYIWRYGNAWKPDDCLTAADARPRVVKYIHKQFGDFLHNSGRERLLVCTQANILSVDFVHAVFPQGKIVHIIRNGREVAASQQEEWTIHNPMFVSQKDKPAFYKVVYNRAREVPVLDLPAYFSEFVGTTWTMLRGSKYRYSMGPKIKNWRKLKDEMNRLAFTAYTWRECVTAARNAGRQLPPGSYYEIKFEDLVSRPEESVPPLLEFLDLPPSKEIDDFIARKVKRDVSGKWLKRLTPQDREIIDTYVGELCDELGY